MKGYKSHVSASCFDIFCDFRVLEATLVHTSQTYLKNKEEIYLKA